MKKEKIYLIILDDKVPSFDSKAYSLWQIYRQWSIFSKHNKAENNWVLAEMHQANWAFTNHNKNNSKFQKLKEIPIDHKSHSMNLELLGKHTILFFTYY